ncbi:MAG: M20/M25/M40 family metallo-hydrolase [Phycisphaerales bacterium]|nr:M20/M25/M40 family metallo-hydrolase [Phycisphaerales bacterium]
MPVTHAEQRLCDSLKARAPAMLADLTRLVAIPTGLNHRAGLDETRGIITQRLEALGAHISIVPGQERDSWLAATGAEPGVPPTAICHKLHVPGARSSVLLAGHLDTVHDPAGPFRELTLSSDGRTATGPGCVDMKGGLVIAIHALEALAEAGIPCAWGFVLNSDEETGSYHSDATLRAEARTYTYGIALEPALPDGSLVVERPGSGQFMIEVHGKASHVGRDFASGVSAVNAMARAILDVAAMANPAAGVITNIGPLQGGAAANVVPDLARAWGNARFASQRHADDLGARLDALATPSDALPRIDIRRSFNRPPKPLTPATEQLALAARAVAEDLGQKLPFGKTGGVCDGNNLQAAGLPTIDTLGVRGGGLHTPQEWIEITSLLERAQMLAVLIARLCERGTAPDA